MKTCSVENSWKYKIQDTSNDINRGVSTQLLYSAFHDSNRLISQAFVVTPLSLVDICNFSTVEAETVCCPFVKICVQERDAAGSVGRITCWGENNFHANMHSLFMGYNCRKHVPAKLHHLNDSVV